MGVAVNTHDLSFEGMALARRALTKCPSSSVLDALHWLWEVWRSQPDEHERRCRAEATLFLLAHATPDDRAVWLARFFTTPPEGSDV